MNECWQISNRGSNPLLILLNTFGMVMIMPPFFLGINQAKQFNPDDCVFAPSDSQTGTVKKKQPRVTVL